MSDWRMTVRRTCSVNCGARQHRKPNCSPKNVRSSCDRKVLRLLETHSLTALKDAVQHALEIGTTNCDAVRLILEYQQEEPISLFCLDGRPHLKLVRVAQTDISVYQSLLMEGTIV